MLQRTPKAGAALCQNHLPLRGSFCPAILANGSFRQTPAGYPSNLAAHLMRIAMFFWSLELGGVARTCVAWT
jgi:hypothetical protein